jgi:methyl-accepting chemotaxis protein
VQSVAQVKALAEQPRRPPGEIGQQVSGIEAATQDSVGAVQEIFGTNCPKSRR